MRANTRRRSAFRNYRNTTFALAPLLLLVLFASSCTQWSHPAKGQREYNTDSTICWRAADESGVTDYWPRYHVYEACMLERGWNAD